jgi:hypothetical protein
VPEEVIRRRYERGLVNFATRYREAADQWQLYDNTHPHDRCPVAHGAGSAVGVIDQARWAAFQHAVARVSLIREALVTDRPPLPDDHLTRAFRDTRVLERAMDVAFARVLRRHRLLNQPLIGWREGRVEYLDPHTVPMPEGVTEEEMGPVFDHL